MEGLAANWEILLFLVGLILLMLEFLFVPGFGVFGVLGIVSVITGLTLSLLQNNVFDFSFTGTTEVLQALITVCLPLFFIVTLLIFFGQHILEIGAFKKLALESTQDAREGYSVEMIELNDYVHKIGKAYTVLRPSGKVMINGKVVDAITDGDWIEKDSEIMVENYQGSYLIVRKLI